MSLRDHVMVEAIHFLLLLWIASSLATPRNDAYTLTFSMNANIQDNSYPNFALIVNKFILIL